MTAGFHLDLCIPVAWTRVEYIREAVGLCVAAVFGDNDLRDSLSMVSAELLENAVKHGKPGAWGIRFTIWQEDSRVNVAVSNAVEEVQAEPLMERLRWIRNFSDPAEAYSAVLARTYEQSGAAGNGGLGLVRIAYEGGCLLDCDISEPGKVTVRASHPLRSATPSP